MYSLSTINAGNVACAHDTGRKLTLTLATMALMNRVCCVQSKAAGVNTIQTCNSSMIISFFVLQFSPPALVSVEDVFWNIHEEKRGVYDFKTGKPLLGIRIALLSAH